VHVKQFQNMLLLAGSDTANREKYGTAKRVKWGKVSIVQRRQGNGSERYFGNR
jgi:hypothetical protein